jgi:iron(III) transport system permease protein
MFWIQNKILGRRGYASVTGKGGERRILKLGPLRWAMFGYALLVCALAVLMPMLVLMQAAFAKAWGRGFSLDNLTLKNFGYLLFEQTQAQQTILNTFVYSGITAFLAIGLSLAIAYVVSRKLVPWSNVLTFLCMAPFVIPGIVLAIGFYAAYANPPFALYGTAWILILAFATRFLPIAYTNSSAAIRSINPELEDAVRILGGSRFTAIWRVVMPLLKRSLAGAFILVFIPATRELSAAIFLYSVNTQVLSVLLFDKSDEGNFEMLASIGLILVLITVALILIGFRLMGRDFMLRRNSA